MENHHLNENFEWTDCTGPFTTISEEQAKAWNRDGCFVMKDVIDRESISRLTADIDPLEAKREQWIEGQGGRFGISTAGAITFTTHVVLQSSWVADFLRNEPFPGLCHDLLGSDVRLYWDQGVYKKPGNPEEFPWHQDNGYTFVRPQTYLTCWIPLVDATIDNGCPWVVPGVHRQGTLKHWWTELGFECLNQPADAVPMAVNAGDIAVFSSLTPHRTGPNLTDGVRKAYIAQFAREGSQMVPRGDQPVADQNDPERQFFVLKDGKPITSR